MGTERKPTGPDSRAQNSSRPTREAQEEILVRTLRSSGNFSFVKSYNRRFSQLDEVICIPVLFKDFAFGMGNKVSDIDACICGRRSPTNVLEFEQKGVLQRGELYKVRIKFEFSSATSWII